MNDQRLTGVAHADALGLGVENDVGRHLIVRALIHVNMAVAGAGLDDRNGAVIHHRTDQPCAASGNQHVHICTHPHKLGRHLPARIFDELDGVPGNGKTIQYGL